MSKDKVFVGQAVLSKILDVVPSSLKSQAGKKHQANWYYKRLSFRVHFVSLLSGVFSYCNGLRELSEGLGACESKLSHLGLLRAPARSTLSDAYTKRDNRYIESVYYGFLSKYHSFILESQLKGLSIRNLKIIDSSTIQLFSKFYEEKVVTSWMVREKMEGLRFMGWWMLSVAWWSLLRLQRQLVKSMNKENENINQKFNYIDGIVDLSKFPFKFSK